jgi:hypothetical protein
MCSNELYKCAINTIINPNPVYSHTPYHVTIWLIHRRSWLQRQRLYLYWNTYVLSWVASSVVFPVCRGTYSTEHFNTLENIVLATSHVVFTAIYVYSIAVGTCHFRCLHCSSTGWSLFKRLGIETYSSDMTYTPNFIATEILVYKCGAGKICLADVPRGLSLTLPQEELHSFEDHKDIFVYVTEIWVFHLEV